MPVVNYSTEPEANLASASLLKVGVMGARRTYRREPSRLHT